MDAGAGAAGRSSYATGGRGWEIKNGNEATSNRVWVTREILSRDMYDGAESRGSMGTAHGPIARGGGILRE